MTLHVICFVHHAMTSNGFDRRFNQSPVMHCHSILYLISKHSCGETCPCTCRLLTGKTARTSRVGLDGLGPKLNGVEELGKRLRRKKRARVASPQPDSRSQSNSNRTPKKVTVRPFSQQPGCYHTCPACWVVHSLALVPRLLLCYYANEPCELCHLAWYCCVTADLSVLVEVKERPVCCSLPFVN